MALKALKNVRSLKRLSRSFPNEERNCPYCLDLTLVINLKTLHTQITKPIGEGSYGSVYEGSWESHHGLERVAVKILNNADVGTGLQLFLKEASILSNLKHPNIIKIHGIVLNPIKLITEFAVIGDMLSYLRIHENVFTAKRLHNYAAQIATAMEFLRQHGIIHRNLAAKSILLRTHDQLKLSRFKDAEYLNEKGIFQSNSGITLERIAWSSIEVLQQGTYSTASDVWSYGITLWEIYSLGAVPWDGLSPVEVTDAYLDNKQLDKPKRCHQLIYNLMLDCWNIDPERRLSFEGILNALNEVPYEEVMTITECQLAEDDSDNLCYKPGDRIVVVDKHTDAWWMGIHSLNGKCGWFQVNNTRSDITPLDTLKHDIKKKKKHLPSITIGLPTNIMHHMHVGRDGEKWYDQPLSPNALKNHLSVTAVKRASSLPSSINTLQDHNGTDLVVDSTELQSSPGGQKQLAPASPQSPLTKTAFTPIYGNADVLKAHTLHQDSSFFTASCPDISHTYQNSANTLNSTSKSPEIEISVPSTPTSDTADKTNVQSPEVPPQMAQTESTSADNTDMSSHTYFNMIDLAGQQTTPIQSPKAVVRTMSAQVKLSPKPAIRTMSAQAAVPLTKEEATSGDDAYLVEAIKTQLPHISRRVITQFLVKNDSNIELAIRDIKLSQLTNMKLDGITEANCIEILEQCNWDLNKAAEMLCS